MPRQARKLSRTGIYHVMLRGINRQDIFEDDEDYRQMTGCLRSLTERYDEMITRTVPTILLFLLGTVSAMAQNAKGQFSVKPMAGVSVSTFRGHTGTDRL